MGFRQSLLKAVAGAEITQKTKYQPNTDILKIPEKSQNFSYQPDIPKNKNPTSHSEKWGV